MSIVYRSFRFKSLSPSFPAFNRSESDLPSRQVKPGMLGIGAFMSAIFGPFRAKTIGHEVELSKQTAWLREMEDFDRF